MQHVNQRWVEHEDLEALAKRLAALGCTTSQIEHHIAQAKRIADQRARRKAKLARHRPKPLRPESYKPLPPEVIVAARQHVKYDEETDRLAWCSSNYWHRAGQCIEPEQSILLSGEAISGKRLIARRHEWAQFSPPRRIRLNGARARLQKKIEGATLRAPPTPAK